MDDGGGAADRVQRVWRRILELPGIWQFVLALVLAAGVGASGYYMYETYDYVQHDNQFCLSCHLMENPYERFARSAHRDLSCKACHQPTMLARSRMAVEQIVTQPDTLRSHAEVPNERCAECHIEGDPERWRLIQNTAGHKVHLESDAPELEGLQCVECHSVSLHRFVPTRQTCGQAGCHEEVRVQLGEMSQLAIHCVACHDFTRPVPEARPASDEGVLLPGREECLSCHEMREQVGPFPADEPHGAECSTCHNPHEQTRAGQVIGTCTEGGCHGRPDTLPNFHHQRESVQLENCAECHRPHEFRIEEENCLGCHREIFRGDRVSASPRDHPEPGAGTSRSGSLPEGTDVVARLALAGSGALGSLLARPAEARRGSSQDTVTFRHGDHESLNCEACHSTGQPTATTNPRFCRSCHHEGPRAASCQRCHRESELAGRTYDVSTTVEMSVRETERRTLTFPHGAHNSVSCGECHRGPPNLTPRDLSCGGCHEEHHSATADCQACHREAPETAHPRRVHVTCTGSGCHESAPVAAVERDRNVCLVCHQEMTDHKPDRRCADCHVLPPARSQGEEEG